MSKLKWYLDGMVGYTLNIAKISKYEEVNGKFSKRFYMQFNQDYCTAGKGKSNNQSFPYT